MFNDFFEDSRSVGVAGLVLGLVVLAGLCGLGMAVMSGNTGPKKESFSSKIVYRDRMIQQLSLDLKRGEEKLEKAEQKRELARLADTMSQKLTTEHELIEKHEESVENLSAALQVIQEEREVYRESYRISERKRAIGEVVDLSETLGADYKKSKIREITPLHIRVMRSSGPVGIPTYRLPESIRDRFQFTDEEAGMFRGQMTRVSEKRNSLYEANQQRLNERKKNLRREAAEHEIAQIEEAISAKISLARKEMRISREFSRRASEYESAAKRAKLSGRISSGQGKASQARRQADLHAKREIRAQQEIANMKQEIAALKAQLRASVR